MLSLPPSVRLWYCPQPVDMRLGFDGLFALVRSRLHLALVYAGLPLWRSRLTRHDSVASV